SRLWLVPDVGPPLHVTLPRVEDAAAGERYYVVPCAQHPWRCLSVVLDTATGPGAGAIGRRTDLAELEVCGRMATGDGVETLVADVVGGGENSADAVRLLGALGARGLEALANAWATLPAAGRRYAVRLFADRAQEPVALGPLRLAAQDGDEAVR